jgi:hypothetical protein
MATQQVDIAPLTPETYHKSHITFGKPYDITEYNYRKARIGYSHPESTDDDFNVLIRATVLHSTAPNDKCRTHSALLRINDEKTINFINKLEEDVVEAMFKNRKQLFDGVSIKGTSALDKLKTQKTLIGYRKKTLIKYSKDYDSYSFGITFGKDITIEHSDSIPEDQRNSDDIVQQLAKGTEVVIAANLNSLSINTSTLKWNLKFDATQFGCLSRSQMSGDRDPSQIWGLTLDELDTNMLVFKNIVTNEYGGKSLAVKYGTKEKSLALQFNDIKLTFVKNENTDKKTGKTTTRFSVAFNVEDKSKFEELDESILNHLFKNQSDFVDGDPTDDLDIFSDTFNSSINEKDGNSTLWSNLYVKTESGDFDFDGKIFNAVGETDEGTTKFESMTNDEVMKLFEGSDRPMSNMSVYLRYVWLGETYSVKWYVSKIQVFTKASKKFNLGIANVARDEEVDEFDGPTSDIGLEAENVVSEEDTTAINSEDEATSAEED